MSSAERRHSSYQHPVSPESNLPSRYSCRVKSTVRPPFSGSTICSIDLVTRFEDMNRLISAVKLRPVIDKVFPFDKAPEALEYLASQKHVGKIVVKVSKD